MKPEINCDLSLCNNALLFLETEKYAHVTFFFNGGREQQFDMEDRKLVPSPKVATYDLQPEMSAAGVGQAVSLILCLSLQSFIVMLQTYK